MKVGDLVRIGQFGNFHGKIGIIIGEVPWWVGWFYVFADGKTTDISLSFLEFFTLDEF